MNNSDLSDLLDYIIVRLTQIATLAGKLHELLGENAQTYSNTLRTLSTNPLFSEKNLAREAATEGFRTIGQLRELDKKDPGRVQQILRQSQLKLQQSMLRVELKLIKHIYPSLTLSSLTIMAFALFEQGLSSLCDATSELRNTALTLADLSGHSTIEKAQRYLSKVTRIQYDFSQSRSWMRIRGHQDVRNLLTHNGGLLDGSDRSRRVLNFLRQDIPGLSIVEDGLQIEVPYVEELVNDVQDWLIEIFDPLSKGTGSDERNRTNA